MTEGVVLDASALLAIIFGEPGQDQGAKWLGNATISAVNLAEVAGKMIAHGFPVAFARSHLAGLDMVIEPFTAEDAVTTGALLPLTKSAGLSLADRACIALAQRQRRPAVTADRAWVSLDLGVEIILIR
jgi:ribonuclease VapC